MDNEYIYIYENHLGGYYTSDEEIPWEELQCETCGDSDMLIHEGTPKGIMKEMQELIDSLAPNKDYTNINDELYEAMYEYSEIAALLGMGNPYKNILDSMSNDDGFID